MKNMNYDTKWMNRFYGDNLKIPLNLKKSKKQKITISLLKKLWSPSTSIKFGENSQN